MKLTKEQRKLIKAWAADVGSKGGKVTGECKRRGDSAYYRAMRAKRKAKE